MNNKFAIGCLVQWYEIEIVGEYIESLKQALKEIGISKKEFDAMVKRANKVPPPKKG